MKRLLACALAISASSPALAGQHTDEFDPILAYQRLVNSYVELKSFHACNSKEWRKEVAFLDRRYSARMESVFLAFTAEYGGPGDFVTVGGCKVFQTDTGYARGHKEARKRFGDSLQRLEAHLNIDPRGTN